MWNRSVITQCAVVSVVLFLFIAFANVVQAELRINYPVSNSVVPGEVIMIKGGGAIPGGTIEVQVLTNQWYVQDGRAEISSNGKWTYGPCHLGGKGQYNNHTIKATMIMKGQRLKSATVQGIVRRD